MGNPGRPWIGLVAFWALAILMAVLGPLSVPESPVADVVHGDAIPAPVIVPSGHFVVSR